MFFSFRENENITCFVQGNRPGDINLDNTIEHVSDVPL